AVAFSADRFKANNTVETPDKENTKYFLRLGAVVNPIQKIVLLQPPSFLCLKATNKLRRRDSVCSFCI
ncbi:MAG: hypothetical protein ACI4QW_04760, partial [Clostridia bacterium]